VEYINYLGSMVTNDERCKREFKSRMVMTKAAFDKTSKLALNLKKKLIKSYIWSTEFYGYENYTLRKLDQKYLESSEV